MPCKIVNLRKEEYDIYIGRGSEWGNPFKIGKDGTREEVIEKYEEWLLEIRSAPNNAIRPSLVRAKIFLKDKILGCFCKPKACHGDILKQFVDRE